MSTKALPGTQRQSGRIFAVGPTAFRREAQHRPGDCRAAMASAPVRNAPPTLPPLPPVSPHNRVIENKHPTGIEV